MTASSARLTFAAVAPARQMCLELGSGLARGGGQEVVLGSERLRLPPGVVQLLGQMGRLGLERGHDVGVGRRVERPGQGALPLSEHAGEPPRPFDHPRRPTERGGEVGLALRRERSCGALRVRVELAELGLEPRLVGPLLLPEAGPLLVPAVEGGELGARHVQPNRPQLVGQAGVRAGGRGLALEGSDLTLDLPDQIEETLEVLLGGREAALGPLPPAAVLEDAGRLFDDRPTILGACLQDRVEVALADDHVLLASDPGVGQQLLDVEQAAGSPVDRVLAVARSEQGPGDGDLGQIRRELAGGVVDGEGDLGPAEGRPGGRPHEDDVLHLRRAHGPGSLGAEHPGDRVDHVRLPTAVRADHDRHARLELEDRRVGEGLESFEGEGLQEHRELTLPARRRAPRGTAHTWQ